MHYLQCNKIFNSYSQIIYCAHSPQDTAGQHVLKQTFATGETEKKMNRMLTLGSSIAASSGELKPSFDKSYNSIQ